MVEIFSEWRRQFDLARTPYDARVALGVAFFNTSADLPGGPYQAEDADLTAISGLTGTNTIYYRSGDAVWTPVVMGPNMTFTAGTLNSIASGGISDAPSDTKAYGRKDAAWVDLGTIYEPLGIGGSIADAPSDGYTYGRQSTFWVNVCEEAPIDGNYWSRRDGVWQIDPGGSGGSGYQPLDADLTALAAKTGTNTIYYRSGAGAWSAVTMGANMTFSGGVLNSTGGGGGITDAPSDSKTYGRKNAAWTDLALAYQPLDADLTSLAAASGTNTIYYRSAADTWSAVTIGGNMTFTAGVLNAVSGGGGGITDAPSDAKTYGRKNAGWVDLALTYQPLDADLTSLAGASGTNTIYYRSAANTWSAVTIGGNLTFTSGTLNAPALDGDLTSLAGASGTNTIYYRSAANTWSPVSIGTGMTFSGGVLASSGGGGGIPEAPTGGTMYVRQSAAWWPLPFTDTDAPSDGYLYGRQSGLWVNAVEEAPFTSSPYARQDGAWVGTSLVSLAREAELMARIDDLERRITALGG